MISPRIRRYLQVQRMLIALAGLAAGLMVSIFTDWLVNQGLTWLPWILGAAAFLALVGGVLRLRQLPGIEVAIRSPRTIRSVEDAQRYARRGFIGFVPLYRPNAGSEAARLTPEARAAAITDRDYARLQVEQSNLYPTIKAIMSHAGRLEHCWLLATSSNNPSVPGSLPYAFLLAAYLREQGLKCKFHVGRAYCVSLDDDVLVLSNTYDQVHQILEQAERLELEPQEIVADITTGFRSMTLGMILACLNGDQDVEFVGTRYNDQGFPTGDLFPIIFSFEPALEE